MPPKRHSLAEGHKVVARNRRAGHDYEVLESVEAGIMLVGAEVKSLRAAQVQLRDSFARVDNGEMWLHSVHIAPYTYAHGFGSFDPDRKRKLLLHRTEIDRLGARVAQEALTLIPLTVYFKDGRAKVELGLSKGRKTVDKRRVIAQRDEDRQREREARYDRY